jgi:hypothetical protein
MDWLCQKSKVQYFGRISRGKGMKNGKVPAAPRVLARIGSTAEWKAGSSAAWPSRGMSGRRSSQAATAEIWDMDISNSLRSLRMIFFFGGRVYTINGPTTVHNLLQCETDPQSSGIREKWVSCFSALWKCRLDQNPAGGWVLHVFWGENSSGIPPRHTQKKTIPIHFQLGPRYSCYLALSMGHWTKEVKDRNDFPSPCASITPSTFTYVLSFFVWGTHFGICRKGQETICKLLSITTPMLGLNRLISPTYD